MTDVTVPSDALSQSNYRCSVLLQSHTVEYFSSGVIILFSSSMDLKCLTFLHNMTVKNLQQGSWKKKKYEKICDKMLILWNSLVKNNSRQHIFEPIGYIISLEICCYELYSQCTCKCMRQLLLKVTVNSSNFQFLPFPPPVLLVLETLIHRFVLNLKP